ncbi:hypothetical protein HPB49_016211 [Dermacentor silvarum]|uniref:Uncharacterized protein n=1 Tax=Dermacentor silvarum TaxID=543639 RepID=A0ACB8CAC0_DERSI|nr:hypothetical protein HPB49_016211 [Dermacentor silvarum]
MPMRTHPTEIIGMAYIHSPSPSRHTCSSSHSQKADGVLVLPLFTVFVGICVVVVTALVATLRRNGISPLAQVVCASRDCMLHAQLLRTACNVSVDPCVDFYAFACGSWESRKKRSRLDTLVTEVYDMAISDLRSTAGNSTKAGKLFRACTQPSELDVDSNLELFKEFRRNLSMFWPEEPPPDAVNVHPIDLLLNLAINWRMGLLFHARILLSPISRTPVFVFTPGTLNSRWRSQTAIPKTVHEYKSHVRKHLQILNVTMSCSSDTCISALRILQSHLVSMVVDVAQGDKYNMAHDIASLAAILQLGKNISLLALINKHSKPYEFGPESPVVMGIKLLEHIDSLFRRHSEEAISDAVCWMFIQEHLWIIADRSDLRVGTSEEGKKLVEYACFDYVSSALGLLAAEDYARNEYTTRSRKRVDSIIGQITLTFYESVQDATWLDADAKYTTLAKIRKLKAQLWPAMEFFDANATEILYHAFPDMTGPFFESFFSPCELFETF